MHLVVKCFTFLVCGVLILALTPCNCQVPKSHECLKIMEIDCANGYKSEGNETICCSDWNVYPNFCFFAQKKCENPALTILYPGPCMQTTMTPLLNTTGDMTGDTTVGTADIIKDVFCTNIDQFNCTDTLDPVCGSDFHFYQNNCDFAKAQCVTPDLTVQDLSACKAGARFKRSLRFV